MSGCNTQGCTVVKDFVDKWLADNHHDVSYSVFEDETLDICIRVMIPGKTHTKVLQGQQPKDTLDATTQTEMGNWLADLPYPKSAVAG